MSTLTHHTAFRMAEAVAICDANETGPLSLDPARVTCPNCRRICGLDLLPEPNTTEPDSYPQVGGTIAARDRDRWFEVTGVSPGRFHVSGYVGYDRSRHAYVGGVRLTDVITWVTHERAFFPMPHEAGEDGPT